MWSIYPAQIQPIVDAMKPDLNEVARRGGHPARRPGRPNWGPIQYDGELHDRATYRYFWELLQKARITGVKMPEEAAARLLRLEVRSRTATTPPHPLTEGQPDPRRPMTTTTPGTASAPR